MADTLLIFMILPVAFAAGVHAVNSKLGEPCTPTTHTCTHSSPELVCDGVNNRCMIQHGKSCSANTSLCVSGAECMTISTNPTEHICSCKAPVYIPDAATGKCTAPAGKWGSACTDDKECGTGMFCSGSPPLCTCFADKKVNLTTGTCDGNYGAGAEAWSFKVGGGVQAGPFGVGGSIEVDSRASGIAASATALMLAATLALLTSA